MEPTKPLNTLSKAHFKPAIKIAVLTLSDRASRGVYADQSGPSITKIVLNESPFDVDASVTQTILPDEEELIVQALTELSKSHDVVFTTGGTGIGNRDVTPEATLRVLSKRIPGICEAVRKETSKQEPMAWLSRAEAGVRNKCLIVNLPGHPQGAAQGSRVVLPLIPRIVQLLRAAVAEDEV